MTWFVVIALAMTAAALAWVLPPLLRRKEQRSEVGVERSASNVAVLSDQLAELDTDLRNGTIAPEHHARARAELERRVLEEGAADPPGRAGVSPGGRRAAAVVGVVVPLSALVLYLLTGNPEGLAPREQADAPVTQAQVEQMVAGLAARLASNPNDAAGWSMLGRSYYALGRYDESVKAYAKAVQVKPDDAGLYADYADALAMSQDRRIDEPVLALVEQALKINPRHLKALVMATTSAYDRQDFKAALTYLQRLQREVPPDTELGRMVAGRVDEVRERAAGAKQAEARSTASAPGATVSGRIALSPALAGKAAPSDTVFILARAPEGPRMPLAVVKRQVKDLPFEFTLSDEQAMAPEMKLSKFREVVIVARVSKSGNAAPQSGDLQGATGTVKVGAANVQVLIDAVVP